jgi:hypothetical protein
MTANPVLPVTFGTVGATSITGNVNSATLASTRFVTLGGTAYVRAPPPAYPDPNPGVAIASSLTAYPQTIAGGTRLQLFSDEAAALVAASAASYS